MIVGRDDLLVKYLDYTHQQQQDNDQVTSPVNPSGGDEDRVRERYLAGEYKIVLQLLGVLANGRLAKRLTDRAVDLCEHMQNLRSAIYDYKLRVEALEAGSKKHAVLKEVALNYLIRYFFLIVFADFLLEEATTGVVTELDGPLPDEVDGIATSIREIGLEETKGRGGRAVGRRFSEWLEERREIQNICKRVNQSLD
ncbi:hypothetical protein HDU67_005062 [Dinochytrium kinnereticum]|nr:hypothetical protein HDU67_005062 [Dinochytrium kinnereticum]